MLFQAVKAIKNTGNGHKMSFKFVKYAQSSQCTSQRDSSVSYASGALVIEWFALDVSSDWFKSISTYSNIHKLHANHFLVSLLLLLHKNANKLCGDVSCIKWSLFLFHKEQFCLVLGLINIGWVIFAGVQIKLGI